MESKLERLSLNKDTSRSRQKAGKFEHKETVVDSWDEEAGSSDSDTETEGRTAPKKSSIPNAPPPTPASPTSGFPSWNSQDPLQFKNPRLDHDDEERRRPEKSTATAGRLIAAGIGMKAPKKSEEQKAYDKAVRENEIRRRKKEKEAREKEREANEKAKASMWES
jgi:hypothetical protein